MGLADNAKAKKHLNLTDVQKNERAANNIRRVLGRAAIMQRQVLKNIKGIIKTAPGSKATILGLMGNDKDEATLMINEMKDFANAHKKSGDPAITV